MPQTIAPPKGAAATAPARATVHRWPPAIWAMLIGSFAVRGFGFAYPFLPYHLDGLGFSTRAAGWIVAAFGAGWLVGQVISGWLTDRLGQRATLASAMAVAAAILPVLAVVRTTVGITAATFLTGMVYDAARPVVSAFIADTIPSESEQTLISGWRHFAVNIGAALTGSLGGYLASSTGTDTLFWANALACAFFGVAAMHFLPDRKRSESEGEPAGTGYREALRDGRLWLLSLASLCALICAGSVFTALPMLMASNGLSAGAYGWTQVANAAAVLALSPLLTPWLSRRASTGRPMTGLLALSSVALGAGMGMAGLADAVVGYSIAAAAAVPGEIILFIAAGHLVNHIAPVGARGLYAGLWGSNLALAVIAAPILAAWALGHGGGVTATWTICGAGLLGAVLCWPLHRLVAAHRAAESA